MSGRLKKFNYIFTYISICTNSALSLQGYCRHSLPHPLSTGLPPPPPLSHHHHPTCSPPPSPLKLGSGTLHRVSSLLPPSLPPQVSTSTVDPFHSIPFNHDWPIFPNNTPLHSLTHSLKAFPLPTLNTIHLSLSLSLVPLPNSRTPTPTPTLLLHKADWRLCVR